MSATDLESAVALLITDTNIISDVVNEDATKEVVTPSGNIPSLRKALTDNLYFQDPIPWSNGDNETNFNQLRTFTDGTVWWSPSATNINPVPMGVTPIGDNNWYPFQDANLKKNILEEVTRFKIKGTFAAGFTYETVDVVGLDNSGNPWRYTGSLPFTVLAGTSPSNPDYQEESFSDHNAKTNRGAVGAHDDIYERTYPTVALMQDEAGVFETGIRIKTYAYNRNVECIWEVTESADNSTGNYSIPLSGGKHAALRPVNTISPAMVGAPSSGDATTAVLKAREFTNFVFLLDGIYGISGSTPIPFLAGQVVKSINGPVTGGAIKAAFIALSPMSTMVDLSQAKYADIRGLILDGASTAERGFRAANTFGLDMSMCRVFNTTVSCYEFVNDGTGTGSFINSLTKCHASGSNSGFVVSSSAAESNLFVFNECVATDCTSYGFREFGDNTGRDNAYNDCDAEKCDVGFLMRSKNFNITNPYIEFCNKGIVVDATGLVNGIQSGKINSPSILGKKDFPDPSIPSEDTIGIELIGFCRNIAIVSPWLAYHNVGIVAGSPVTGLKIDEPFIENTVTPYDINTRRYKIRTGNQESSIVVNNSSNNVTFADAEDTFFVDLGNSTLNWTVDISDWLIGRSVEIVTLGVSANVGTFTLNTQSGVTFFGQNRQNRVSGDTSITCDTGCHIKLWRQSENVIYFIVSKSQ